MRHAGVPETVFQTVVVVVVVDEDVVVVVDAYADADVAGTT
jgi:hypothetical protein